jgi:opacity protein-like surface antigen
MSRVRTLVHTFALLAATTVAAGTVGAQVAPKQFAITTRLGASSAERSASLEPAVLIGLDTEYALTRWFGLGAAVDVSRGNTTREDFLTRLRYGNAAVGGGDSIYYQYIGQPVNQINLSAFATLRYPNAKVSPFLLGGVGNYTLIADQQVSGRTRRESGLSYTGGAGVSFRIGERVGVQLDARAVTLTDYDRDLFNPAAGRPELRTPFPEDFPTPPAKKNTAMSTVLTLGFRYIPGGLGGGN